MATSRPHHAPRNSPLDTVAASGQYRASLRGSSPVVSHVTPRTSPVQPKSAIPE